MRVDSDARAVKLLSMPMRMETALELMETAHERGRLAHALLLTGPQGCGKRELAAGIVQMLNSEEDQGTDLWGEPVAKESKPLEELEGEFVRIVSPRSKSRRIRVEQMRELEKSLFLAAPEGKWKVGVIIDAERMGEGAANAFLKTLEEPPKDSLLLLLTTEPERLLPTIVSRCVELSLLPRSEVGSELGEHRSELGRVLRQLAHDGPSIEGALAMKAAFEGALAEMKTNLESHYAEILKAESDTYKQGSDGRWLDEREEEMKATLSAQILSRQAGLIRWLEAWLGDAVRLKCGGAHLQLSELADLSRQFSEKEPVSKLIERCGVLGSMARDLETNAHPALVLEVGFLKAFS